MTVLDLTSSNGVRPGRDSAFGLRSRVWMGLLTAAVLVGVCGYWAGTFKLSGAVIAGGTVKVDQELKQVQHRDGGIIGEIAVREGDIVAAGDVLILLDDAQTRAELAIVAGQMDELAGRRARLIAERDEKNEIAFPESFGEPSAELAALIGGETQLFTGNVLNRSRQKEQLELQIVQLEQERLGLNAQLSALSAEIELVKVEHEKMLALSNDGLVEGSRVYSVNRELVRMMGERGEVEAAIARVQGRESEIRLQIITVGETARNEAQRELRQVEASLSELRERRTAIEDRLARAQIRAPIDGVVNELNVTTVGGIITPAETLITIVPAQAKLTVEARVRTTDVDQISVGQPASLRFSAFNQRVTPEIDATISRLSAAPQTEQFSQEAYYLAEISVPEGAAAAGLTLKPGMPVEVFVETKEMTLLEYIGKPLTDQFARAFREE